MKIDFLNIKNFKCFETLEMEFHPSFNILLGNNGTGKTSVLEALRVAIGSLYLGFDKYEDKIVGASIIDDDVRLYNLETQYPTVVSAKGTFYDYETDVTANKQIEWTRSLESRKGKTLYKEATQMLKLSKALQKQIRTNVNVSIPLLAYFSTDRYKKERREQKIEPKGSRLRGYYNALDASTNSKFFLNLLYTETLGELQFKERSVLLESVKNAICKCVDCKSLDYILQEQELYIELNNGQKMPFHLLSDGVRSTLAMVMEIAVRCFLLNPQFGARASELTHGIVLIDEIDLHLHPSWQRHIANDLRNAFPSLQFIATTHAPLVISELDNCKIYSIGDGRAYNFPIQNGRDANYILKQMNVAHIHVQNDLKINKYFSLIEQGKGYSQEALQIRQEIETEFGKEYAVLERADIMLSFFQ